MRRLTLLARSTVIALVTALAIAAPAAARPGAIVAVEHPGDTPTMGRADALVTVDLYFVPGTAPSLAAYRAVRELALKHPTRVRARFYPRPIGPHQITAAVSLLAHRQGSFFTLLDALTAAPTTLGVSAAIALAIEHGLDREQVLRAARDPAIAATLADNDHRAFRVPVSAVVDVVLNGVPASQGPVRIDATSAAQLEAAYQVALTDARLAAAQGLGGARLRQRNRLALYCDDSRDDEGRSAGLEAADDDDDDDPEALARARELAAPPRYAWSLGRLIDQGTRCPAPSGRPARLDDPPMTDERALGTTPLLTAPLPVAGAPSIGPATAAVPVVVACNPRGESCRSQLSALRSLVEIYEGDVRLVWVPWVDLGFEAAPGDVELAAAALCAGEMGDGWPFTSDPAGVRREPPAIPDLARESHVDPGAVAACAAGARDRALTMIAAAERAGIGWGPTVVIAGRAYIGGFIDARAAAAAIEHALAPGLFDQLGR